MKPYGLFTFVKTSISIYAYVRVVHQVPQVETGPQCPQWGSEHTELLMGP